jgi:hypothetical protein
MPDNGLRPCIEDLIGAGAIINKLEGTLSPESKMALSVINSSLNDLGEIINKFNPVIILRQLFFPKNGFVKMNNKELINRIGEIVNHRNLILTIKYYFVNSTWESNLFLLLPNNSLIKSQAKRWEHAS